MAKSLIMSELIYKREIETGIYQGEEYTEKVLSVYQGGKKVGFIIKDNDIKEWFFCTSLNGSYDYSGTTQRELKEILEHVLFIETERSVFMKKNPVKCDSIINQSNQLVTFYMNPENESLPLIAVIGEFTFDTGFFDTGDFFKDSDYNPILINGIIKLHYEL
tara:strand:- start:90 stop:575 length:486 start_codon:yes stop_codon:yes gene_type:complete